MHPTQRLRSRTIRSAARVDRGVLYTTISAGMILARAFLTSRGTTAAFADRYGSPFGRAAAKIFRERRGTEPRRAWSQINGIWRRVMGYTSQDLPVLNAALAAYPRTAYLAAGVAA